MLLRYIEDFQNLHTNMASGVFKPFKPALLLAVLAGVEEGSILSNKIYITPALVTAFRKQLVTLGATRPYQARNFAYPFYHLKSEEFWRLKKKPGKKIVLTAANSVSGLRSLSDAVEYAQLDVNLWDLLLNEKTRNRLRGALLGKYAASAPGEAE